MNFMSTADADTEIETVEVTGGGRGRHTYMHSEYIFYLAKAVAVIKSKA